MHPFLWSSPGRAERPRTVVGLYQSPSRKMITKTHRAQKSTAGKEPAPDWLAAGQTNWQLWPSVFLSKTLENTFEVYVLSWNYFIKSYDYESRLKSRGSKNIGNMERSQAWGNTHLSGRTNDFLMWPSPFSLRGGKKENKLRTIIEVKTWMILQPIFLKCKQTLYLTGELTQARQCLGTCEPRREK